MEWNETDRGKKWLKLWTSILTDSKTANMPPAQFGKWIRLMLAVKLEGINGILTVNSSGLYLRTLMYDPESPYDFPDFESAVKEIENFPSVKVTRVTEGSLLSAVKIAFTHWEEYQSPALTNAERQALFRQRRQAQKESNESNEKRNREVTTTVTQSNEIPSVSVSISNTKNSIKKEEIFYKQVIEYLNTRSGKHFKPIPSNTKYIKARIKEGATLEDFYRVIDIKCSEWFNTEQEQYLRPETLFAGHFDSYRNQIPRRQRQENTKDEIEEMKRATRERIAKERLETVTKRH